MRVKVKKLSSNAKLPYKKYDSDFCYDLYATSCEEIAPNVYKYGLGLAFQIERAYEKIFEAGGYRSDITIDTSMMPLNLSIDIRPRSSVWKTGMVLSNCEGTVDEL